MRETRSFPVTNRKTLAAPISGRIEAIHHQGYAVEVRLDTRHSFHLILEDAQDIVRAFKADLRGRFAVFDGRFVHFPAEAPAAA
ncbi:hypothetical protein O0235_00765 [Tepidiforma flava]|uniref:Uncharacterized protein n=1 Tax=Tepidiforma flava TaxID=3004094 RepID=A0ABY7M968_9CHLR|nr:hypothetical protein [Tepidiforma flava]WBL36183.1 hypothetical protein O0235_00765 [Tepidiforma flava]